MNLKENYERFFGKMDEPEQKKNPIISEDVRGRFAYVATIMAKKYPNAPLTIKEGYVWMGGKKVEPAAEFVSRPSQTIHEMVRSFSNSQSKRLL
jgi:hypothetical protein